VLRPGIRNSLPIPDAKGVEGGVINYINVVLYAVCRY
jgi:hypothetical protein